MPPPAPKPIVKPKPITRPNFANEIEFKGYFILKGQAYFSLFNKKVKHAEWITINEKTYEEFTAEKFDLETETLTILFEGQSFELQLIQAKSGTALPSSGKTIPSIPRPSASIPKSNTPRYMPPKPKTTPQIPTWLVNRNNPSRPRSSTASTSRSFGSSLPGLPSPGSVPRRTFGSNPQTNTNPPSNPFTNLKSRPESSTVTQTNPELSASTPSGIQDSSTGSLNNIEPSTDGGNGNTDIGIDLENLPPPPPPPNILPPSPPPNLLPSREE